MIIQNKKTGERRDINPEQWKTLNEVGFGKFWNVIMRDTPPPIEDAKVLPLDIKEFSEIKPAKNKSHGRRKSNS